MEAWGGNYGGGAEAGVEEEKGGGEKGERYGDGKSGEVEPQGSD